jgi:hypothetical protein
LPLEALIFLPPSSLETQTNDLKKGKKTTTTTAAKVSKPMKTKPTQVINENVVSSSGRMNLKPKQSEEPPLFYKRPIPSQEPTRPLRTNSVGGLSGSTATHRRAPERKGSTGSAARVGRDEDVYDGDAYVSGDDEYLLEEVNGGDESAPPPAAPDFDIREEMVKDLRIADTQTNPKPISSVSLHQTSRPLYRPLTTFNLLNPPSPSPDSGEATSPIPKYEWMRRSLAPTQQQPQQSQRQRQQKETQTKEKDSNEASTRPKFTTTTFDFDPRLLDPQGGGVSDGRTQSERPSHLNDTFPSKSQRSRANQSTPSSSNTHRRQPQEDSIVTDKLNFSSEDNFFVDGIRFGGGGGGHRDDMATQQRPQSAASSTFRKNPSSTSRPSSAGSTRRSAAGSRDSGGLSSSLKGSVKKQTSDFLRGDEQKQEEQARDERLKRDLRRTEREIKIKEAALKRQAKRHYGVSYDDI